MLENFGSNLIGMLNGNGRNKTTAEINNLTTKEMYAEQLISYALIRYKWENLPEDFDERFMELTLNFKGGFVGFRNKYGKLVVTQFATNGRLNMYYNPTKVYSVTIDGEQEQIDDDFVICWNNWLRMPTVPIIYEFAERISDITRTLDVHINAEKIPYIFVGNRKRTLTLRNLFARIKRNEPAIYVDEETGAGEIKTIDLKHNFNGVSIYELKRSFWSECLTFLGVDNASISKRERVNTAETDLSNKDSEMSRYIGLTARRDFCKEFNRIFGTDIWVHYRTFEDETVSEDEHINEVINNYKASKIDTLNVKEGNNYNPSSGEGGDE